MKTYIGTKVINAKPMTRGDYNAMRGWAVPSDENPADEGFLVEYRDGGKANVPGFDGYVSWSPKDVFERAYLPLEGMGFGSAIDAMRKGLKVSRAGWNGKGMFIFLVEGSTFHVNRKPLLGMKTVDGTVVPWVASQSDILADDWMSV